MKSKEDYQALFAEYSRELPTKAEALKRLMLFFKEHQRIALICFEKENEHCHRHRVSDYLQQKYQLDCQNL